MLELENQLLTLKKGNMLVEEYTNAFITKKEFDLCLYPMSLQKPIGPLRDFHGSTFCQLSRILLLKQLSGCKAMESMTKARNADMIEVGEKRKSKGFLKSNKKSKLSKSKDQKYGSNGVNMCD